MIETSSNASIARDADLIHGQHDSSAVIHSTPQCLGLFADMIQQARTNSDSNPNLQIRDQDIHHIAVETMRLASAALDVSRPDLCLERLEKGRYSFWAQALNLRSLLEVYSGDDARDAVQSSVELEQINSADLEPGQDQYSNHGKDGAFKRQRFIPERIHYSQWLGLDEGVVPFTFQTLSEMARGGIIVYLLCTCKRCDAVAITSEGTALHIPLPDATPDFAGQLARTVKLSHDRYRSQIGPPPSKSRAFKTIAPDFDHGRSDKQSMLITVLADLWRLVVKPIINGLGLKSTEGRKRPRITWIPRGLFASIPIHAAGVYEGPDSECCSDYFVSSYAPSIPAAHRAQAGVCTTLVKDARVLLIAEPDAPGMPPLSNATDEVNRVVKLLPPGTRLSPQSPTPSGSCTVSEALFLLPQASILHLACHGYQDALDFLMSGFYLSDGCLTAADIMKHDLPHALFAFLSACETAKGNETQRDHFFHLAGAMVFAGFKSIVGTMWEMGDADGPLVATTVYRELFKGDMLDLSIVPYVLDEAVQALRTQGVPANRWATFVHIGA